MDTRFRGRKQNTDLPLSSPLEVSLLGSWGFVVVLQRVRGVARCLPGAGQTLPANNRVTSRKPLTAAGELVLGEGGRGSQSVAATAALERGSAAERAPAPCADELRWGQIAKVSAFRRGQVQICAGGGLVHVCGVCVCRSLWIS